MAVTTVMEKQNDDAAALPERTKLVIMIGVLLGLFLEAVDQTIIATALPAIVVEFQGINLLGWVSTGYLLASTALVPIYGKLSDIYGRRAIILFGIVVFLVGSMLCGLASSMIMLVAFRVVQGIGAAAVVSTAFAVPADLYPPAERARVTGMIGAVFGLASVIGPFLGGVITTSLGWRWVFYVNLPVGLIALGFISLRMPKLGSTRREPIDWWGTALLLLTVVPLLLGLSLDKTLFPWSSPLIIGLLLTALVALVAFLLVERRAPSPIIPLDLFRDRTFALISAISFLMGAAFLSVVLFLSLFLVNVVGVSAASAGTTLIPFTLSLVASAISCGVLIQRIGRYQPVMLAGLAVMTVGFGLLATMNVATTQFGVVLRVIVLGLGAGAVVPVLQLAVQNAVPFERVGSATASVQFFQQIGSTIGAAVAGLLLASMLTAQLTANLAPTLAELSPAAQASINIDQLRNGETGNPNTPSSQAELASQIGGDAAAKVQAAVRASFASSVTQIYLYSIVPIVLSLLLVFLLPNLELRKDNKAPPPIH